VSLWTYTTKRIRLVLCWSLSTCCNNIKIFAALNIYKMMDTYTGESSVAQRKRVGLITQRSEDRNLVELNFCPSRSPLSDTIRHYPPLSVTIRHNPSPFCRSDVVLPLKAGLRATKVSPRFLASSASQTPCTRGL
jgi:hypothetical protein